MPPKMRGIITRTRERKKKNRNEKQSSSSMRMGIREEKKRERKCLERKQRKNGVMESEKGKIGRSS
jgi:hypothetical protein